MRPNFLGNTVAATEFPGDNISCDNGIIAMEFIRDWMTIAMNDVIEAWSRCGLGLVRKSPVEFWRYSP